MTAAVVTTRATRALLERVFPRGAIVLTTLSLVYFVMGVVRNRIFANVYGAGAELDAYNAAFRIPEIALDILVASGLAAPFVPIYTSLRERDGDERPGQKIDVRLARLFPFHWMRPPGRALVRRARSER